MGQSRYVELHARSAFSFLQGASLPAELVAVASTLDISAVALTDIDGLYGAPRFYQAARKANVTPHIGAEVTGPHGARYTLLVENRTGYQNLCRLITRMKLRARKGAGSVTHDDLAEYACGLVCLTGGPEGPLHFALQRGGIIAARRCLAGLQELFGADAVYGELQRGQHRREEERNQAILALAAQARAPLIATNGVLYAQRHQRDLFDVLTCLHHKRPLSEAGRLLARNGERYLKTNTAMRYLFRDIPHVVERTADLSDRLAFTLQDLGYQFPRYPVGPGETEMSFLRQRTDEGARSRYDPYHDKVRRQIERELAMIEKLQLPGYFLIVWDIVRYCRTEGILVQGRGSAANSAVCYSLGITAVDPVGMDLLFERFLSEERAEMPDIDLDLPSGSQREKVIQYVYHRYGERGAAMTANVITYRSRLAARDVGKVLGFDEDTQARLAKASRGWEWKDPDDTTQRRFADVGLDVTQFRVRKYSELFTAIQDIPRHLGQHSGGLVICQGELDSIVPLEPASMPGRVVVQWDKDDCASLGLVKVDLLGLGMMAVLEDSLTLIRDHYSEAVDLTQIPKDDAEVYEALRAADTIGLFQVESRAQMATLPRLKPRCFYDLVVEVAIIRPGPIVGKLVHPYLERRENPERISYLHADLEPVLKRTLGIPLFQEQLLKMAMIVAGFTGGEAEELRRAFGFKRSERRMKEVEVKLRAGMDRKGIAGPMQETIIQSITSFALYGFPESHAASFALLAYASAYLRTHYLAAFTAALLNNQPMGFYSPATIIKDAQRHGLSFLPVDLNVSAAACTIEQRKLRLGLNYVRGLRRGTAETLVTERERHGAYASLESLVHRVPVLHSDEVRQLAAIGALNTSGAPHRREALWQAERAVRPAGPLLHELAGEDENCPLSPMEPQERMTADYQGTGVNLGAHPLAWMRPALAHLRLTRSDELAQVKHGRSVTVAGAVICRQRPGTANGFLFLSLEDEAGILNVIVEPDLYAQERPIWSGSPFLLVEGTLQNKQNVVSIRARSARAIPTHGLRIVSHDFH